MKKGLCIIGICVLVCVSSCGVTQPKGSIETVKESATPKATLAREDTKILFRKENVKIAGRHYTYIDYKIELGGFISLYSLKTNGSVLYIPAQIDGKPVRNIEGEPFKYAWQKNKKSKLKKIVIPEGVKEIHGFANVVAEEVVLPKSLKKIHMQTFEMAKIEKVVIKNPGTQIEKYAFSESTLEKIDFPNGFSGKLEERCFEKTRLTEFCWPDYNKKKKGQIGEGIFGGCKKLKRILFPENQKHIYIPHNTFWGCTVLNQLEFPASTKRVTYKECYYADNYKRGVSTLVFRGKNTEVTGGNAERFDLGAEIPKGKKFITVKKIIAPSKSKALQFAKKAVKISYMPEWTPEIHISYSEPIKISLNKENLVPVEYETSN